MPTLNDQDAAKGHTLSGVVGAQELALSVDQSKPGKFRLGHRTWLDVLRGLAVLTVITHHFKLIRNGNLGVDIFFVLSGFLITCILCEEYERTKSISLKNFYIRRMFRLLPLLYVLVAGYLVVTYFCFSSPDFRAAARESLLVATYSANLQSIHSIDQRQLGYTWSLCAEEHFYFVWPIVLLVLFKLKASRTMIVAILVAGITAVVLWRAHLYRNMEFGQPDIMSQWYRIYTGTDARADSLLVGCLLGLFASWNLLPTSRRGIYALTAVGMLAVLSVLYCIFKMPVFHSYFMNGLYTGFAVMVALAMAWMLVNPPAFVNGKSLPIATLAATGKISYALYLIHIPVMLIFTAISGHGLDISIPFGWNHPLATGSAFAVIVALSIPVHIYIERPFLRLKKRFETVSVKPESADIIGFPAHQTTLQTDIKRAA